MNYFEKKVFSKKQTYEAVAELGVASKGQGPPNI